MEKKALINKTGLLVLSRFGSRMLAALFGLWAARKLGPAAFGRFVFVTSFVYVFIPFADFGIENYLLRIVPRRPHKRVKILRSLFYPRLMASFVAYLLVVLAGLASGYSLLDVADLAAFGLMLIPYSLNFFFQAYFNAQGKIFKSSLIKISYPLIYILMGIVFLTSGGSYRHVYWSITLSLFFSTGILLKYYPQVWWPIRPSWHRFVKTIRKTWPYAILVALAVFYLKVDVLILKRLEGDAATGYYGPVSDLFQTVILIPQSLAIVLFPLSSRLMADNPARMKRLYWRIILVLLLASLPLAMGGYLLADWGVMTFLGAEYLPSVPALRLACFALILFFVNAFPGNVIQNSARVKKFIPWAVSNVGVNVLLNLMLIPGFSLFGAVLAKVGSELYGFVINNLFVRRVFREL